MRKIAATYVYPLSGDPIKNGILVCDDDGTIVEVINKGKHFREEAGVEYYSGVLAPGFVVDCKSQNFERPVIRKIWSAGIALLLDVQNRTAMAVGKEALTLLELDTSSGTITNTAAEDMRWEAVPEQLLAEQDGTKERTLDELLRTFSLKRAGSCGLEAQFGSFSPGTKPGVNLISGVDFKEMRLTKKTKIKRLL